MAAEPAALREPAFAKVNLSLHVRGRRPDGYHLLESLVVFPRIGDLLHAEPAGGLSLAIRGPFAGDLGTGGDNLVLRAAAALGPGRGAALTLEKRLPVASGIGGGSADAAAALRLMSRLRDCAVPAGAALALGADVPVCLASRPAMMGGIGEVLEPAPAFPEFWLVLVNPLIGVPTGAVFAGLARRDNPPGPPAPSRFGDFAGLTAWLAAQRNDLEAPAARLCPAIPRMLDALKAGGAALARMSGSGATCFGLYAREADAMRGAERLRAAEPGWWVAAGPVPACRPAGPRPPPPGG